MKCNTFILKCVLQFTCTNLDGSQKEESNFLNLLQIERGTQKGGGVPNLMVMVQNLMLLLTNT